MKKRIAGATKLSSMKTKDLISAIHYLVYIVECLDKENKELKEEMKDLKLDYAAEEGANNCL